MDNVVILTQIYKNNISDYSSLQTFIASFQHIKSPIYKIVFFMISMGLYYNHCMLE
jgi:hypothetical protein